MVEAAWQGEGSVDDLLDRLELRVTVREVQEMILQHSGYSVSHPTVYRWLRERRAGT